MSRQIYFQFSCIVLLCISSPRWPWCLELYKITTLSPLQHSQECKVIFRSCARFPKQRIEKHGNKMLPHGMPSYPPPQGDNLLIHCHDSWRALSSACRNNLRDRESQRQQTMLSMEYWRVANDHLIRDQPWRERENILMLHLICTDSSVGFSLWSRGWLDLQRHEIYHEFVNYWPQNAFPTIKLISKTPLTPPILDIWAERICCTCKLRQFIPLLLGGWIYHRRRQ